jgi:hypothetical protein
VDGRVPGLVGELADDVGETLGEFREHVLESWRS